MCNKERNGHAYNFFYFNAMRSTREDVDSTITHAISWYHGVKDQNPGTDFDEFHYRLVLDELLTNALVHGNRNNSNAIIRITIRIATYNIEIAVYDEGPGFRTIPDVRSQENMFKKNGRGLFLLQNLGSVIWDNKTNCAKFTFGGTKQHQK